MKLLFRDANPDDLIWVREILVDAWASTQVVSRGIVHQADKLPGIIATVAEERVGFLTYHIQGSELEIVTLNSLKQREGIGRGLVKYIEGIARKESCSRIWVITTNDNEDAVSFYEALGFQTIVVHKDAIENSRKLKPEIPLIGINDGHITDEIELQKLLS